MVSSHEQRTIKTRPTKRNLIDTCQKISCYTMSVKSFSLYNPRDCTVNCCLFACPANQHPKYTINNNNNIPCLPCLIIIHSCYFDCRNKPSACYLCVICVSLCRRITCAKDHRLFFFLNYPQINDVENSGHILLVFSFAALSRIEKKFYLLSQKTQ